MSRLRKVFVPRFNLLGTERAPTLCPADGCYRVCKRNCDRLPGIFLFLTSIDSDFRLILVFYQEIEC